MLKQNGNGNGKQTIAPKQPRVLPNNIEAEQAVLGSVVLDAPCYIRIANQLKPEHFYLEKHRITYETFGELSSASKPIDFLTVTSALEQKGRLAAAGGSSYIAGLLASVPTSAHIEHYAHIVKHAAESRDMIQFATEIAELAYQIDDDADLYTRVQDLLLSHAPQNTKHFESAYDVAQKSHPRITESIAHPNEVYGYNTGFTQLNRAMGGWQAGGCYLVAGNASVGKTFWLLSAVLNLAFQKIPGAVVSLEMSNEQLYHRFLGIISGIPSINFLRGAIQFEEHGKIKYRAFTKEESEKIDEAKATFEDLPIYFCEDGLRTATQMRAGFIDLKMRYDIKYGAVDYAQLMGDGTVGDTRNNELAKESRGLKGITRDVEDFFLLVLSQMNRQVTARENKRGKLSDLRDSGSLEQDFDWVQFLYDEVYWARQEGKQIVDTNIIEGIIAKDRLSTSVGKTIKYQINPKTRWYSDAEGE